MKRFFGIILIIISFITILFSLMMMADEAGLAVFSLIVLFIPGVIVLVTGIKMCGRPKSRSKSARNDQYPTNDQEHLKDIHPKGNYNESSKPVSVHCSGCGAKVEVYPNLSANCEYCGTTVRTS
ncbi:hypothetical protein Q9R46_12210 [Paenibacillus sp. RRE4]|uniref:hypothetical protein n=1 Tax=Paenibacillus sp. RRE4 TaxID=2962587 RepID=UPI0028816C7B|nr:hypothetical protein [Paenibacillus sp. RRE4]MDT0123411.1 hypothetical protein [Paenibacillus sp. RRE4]